MVSFGSQLRAIPKKHLVQYIDFFFQIVLSVKFIAVHFILYYVPQVEYRSQRFRSAYKKA